MKAICKSIIVQLAKEDLIWSQKHAENIVNYYGGVKSEGSGTYNHNKISGNLVGVKGEVALSNWLQQSQPLPILKNFEAYDDKSRSQLADIQVGSWNIEVKGLRPHQWDQYKRMVPPRQLRGYVASNAIVVWTTSAGDSRDANVMLKGWNFAKEIGRAHV